MKHKSLLILFISILSFQLTAQQLQTPDEFLGYKLGSRFTRHHKVVDYFKYIAQNSDKVKFQEYGKTNELRTLAVAFVSSADNINNLETIRKQHLTNTGIENTSELKDKSVVWLSYNVHGNEASSTEASMLTLYKLVTEHSNYLENTVVIMDPCINPDGRDRYANWYNQVVATPYNKNPDAREHNEPWPGGRPNHYLFDLNRDWAWATQVETQQRLKVFNKWLPHIHVDFHEQGINNPYYFAPAVEPYHEVITDWQRDFQTQIGKNHAKYFDKNGWYYFTKESFDLLYPSYGDTYPTYVGGIGMTYEQAGHGRAGLGITKADGEELTLWDRLIHHTTSGISTVEMASKNTAKINAEFKKYFNSNNFKYKSYVLRGNQDKIKKLVDLLNKHEVKYGFASNNRTVSGFNYETKSKGNIRTSTNDLIVSINQPKARLVKALFEPVAKLSDSITYDITAWSLPYAYGFKAIASERIVPANNRQLTVNNSTVNRSAYAYTFKWNHLSDSRLLADLLEQNFRVRFNRKEMTNSGQNLKAGSLIVTRGDNKHIKNFDNALVAIANKHQKKATTINTGFSQKGPDMGSSSVRELKKQKIAILSGNYTSSLSYGEIQYFFEKELMHPYTAINTSNFSTSMLDNYHTLVIPNGYYGGFFNKSRLDGLRSWIRKGGKVIAIGGANSIFANKKGFGLKTKSSKKKDDKKETPIVRYEDLERDGIQNAITGAIFKTKIDNSHPLGFGYGDSYFTLKQGTRSYKYLENGYNVVRLEDNSVFSGFAGSRTTDRLEKTLIFGEQNVGRGSVVYMVDNPLFRAFWENGKLFFANALFFANPSMKKL
jgi:hypothetical protein